MMMQREIDGEGIFRFTRISASDLTDLHSKSGVPVPTRQYSGLMSYHTLTVEIYDLSNLSNILCRYYIDGGTTPVSINNGAYGDGMGGPLDIDTYGDNRFNTYSLGRRITVEFTLPDGGDYSFQPDVQGVSGMDCYAITAGNPATRDNLQNAKLGTAHNNGKIYKASCLCRRLSDIKDPFPYNLGVLVPQQNGPALPITIDPKIKNHG